jgi:hypothetical protein
MGLFDDDKDKEKEGIKVDNDDLLETAARLFKIQVRANPNAIEIRDANTLVAEYLKVFRALKVALKNEAKD